MSGQNSALIRVLRDCIHHAEARIERSQAEIQRCKLELAELGVELPLQESLPNADVQAQYNELLYAVARKFRGESRHETALRYIRERETVVTLDRSTGSKSNEGDR